MDISASTRTVVKSTHALITPDGYISSVIPGWTGCTPIVVISEQMGAGFSQIIVNFREGDGSMRGVTLQSQLFLYVVEGKVEATVGGVTRVLSQGQFVYVPPGTSYLLTNREKGTRVLCFQKVYELLEDTVVPGVLFGDAAEAPADPVLNDPAVRMQVLLPDNLAFDMAVNILTYDPGGYLPLVETHIMEHGLLYLRGQGIYRLGEDWYPVKKGDSIWMAPYCNQWFTAMGKEPAVYIYYKNVNRFPGMQ
jgi:(S)-ureidoglycine aminohydrolase